MGLPRHPSDIMVVVYGLVKSTFTSPRGGLQHEVYLGSGGVLGLTSSLLGVPLPRTGAAVALADGLRRGPVVFIIPGSIVGEIMRGARNQDPIMVQLELDLFRVAGLFALERLRGEVIAEVEQECLYRLKKGTEISSHWLEEVEAGAFTQQPRSEKSKALMVARRVVAHLRHQLRNARMERLEPGEILVQCGNIVLLRGIVFAKFREPEDVGSTELEMGGYAHEPQESLAAPAVLLWPALLVPSKGKGILKESTTHRLFTAGSTGAVLLICGCEADELERIALSASESFDLCREESRLKFEDIWQDEDPGEAEETPFAAVMQPLSSVVGLETASA